VSTQSGESYVHSLHALVNNGRKRRSTAEMKERRRHIVMLFPAARKTLDGSENLSQQFGRRGAPVSIAKLLQPLNSELIPSVIECIRDSIRAEEHRVPRLQSQG
jgi:hypothetical protein